MRAAGFVALDRGDHQRALEGLERAKEVMASGINIWIAPEGTRSDDGPLLPFKRGGFKMALQVQAPILPITINGSRDVLPSKDYRVRKGQTVRITFHPPVLPADYESLPELMEAVRAAIDSGLPKEMQRPAGSATPPVAPAPLHQHQESVGRDSRTS